MGTLHMWTDEEVEYLRQHYPNQRSDDVAAALGIPVRLVYSKAHRLDLKKSAAFLDSDASGRMKQGASISSETQFKCGHQTWNKGKKGATGNHPNSRATQFKKGDRNGIAAVRYQPIGTERVNSEGYLERKVNDDNPAQRRWVTVHRLVWQSARGSIPKGYVVCFLPGRRTTVAAEIVPEILELVHRADLARRNHWSNQEPELGKLVQLKGAITRQVNRIAREAKEKQS